MSSIFEKTPIDLSYESSNGKINTALKLGDNERVFIPGGYRIFRISSF